MREQATMLEPLKYAETEWNPNWAGRRPWSFVSIEERLSKDLYTEAILSDVLKVSTLEILEPRVSCVCGNGLTAKLSSFRKHLSSSPSCYVERFRRQLTDDNFMYAFFPFDLTPRTSSISGLMVVSLDFDALIRSGMPWRVVPVEALANKVEKSPEPHIIRQYVCVPREVNEALGWLAEIGGLPPSQDRRALLPDATQEQVFLADAANQGLPIKHQTTQIAVTRAKKWFVTHGAEFLRMYWHDKEFRAAARVLRATVAQRADARAEHPGKMGDRFLDLLKQWAA